MNPNTLLDNRSVCTRAIIGDLPGASPPGAFAGSGSFLDGELHYKADFGGPSSQTNYQTQNTQNYYS